MRVSDSRTFADRAAADRAFVFCMLTALLVGFAVGWAV